MLSIFNRRFYGSLARSIQRTPNGLFFSFTDWPAVSGLNRFYFLGQSLLFQVFKVRLRLKGFRVNA